VDGDGPGDWNIIRPVDAGGGKMPPITEDPTNMSDGHGLSCEEQKREEALLESVAGEVKLEGVEVTEAVLAGVEFGGWG